MTSIVSALSDEPPAGRTVASRDGAVLSTGPTGPPPSSPGYHRPISTFVLVHGAMHGGWCWGGVRQRLTGKGHSVFTPTLTGQGDRRGSSTPEVGVETHVTDLTDLLWFEDLHDVHLVLHSYAGILAGPVVARERGRIASLTLVGGFITQPGETLLDVEPPEVRARYQQLASDGDHWLLPASPSFLAQWGVTDPELAAWVGPRLTDFPRRCQTEPTVYDHAVLSGLRSNYVRHTHPPLASLELSYRRAAQAGWELHDVACGHDIMLEEPDTIADLLVRISEDPGTSPVDPNAIDTPT